MTALEIVRLVGTEFADVADNVVEQWIELVKPLVSKKKFSSLYEQALAYLAMHRMKVAGLGCSDYGSVSDMLGVSSYSEGSTSVSFNGSAIQAAVTSGNTDDLLLTTYGITYLSIRKKVIVPITCAGGSYDGS